MGKKNYQINVINAESIKKQNDEENKGAQQSQTNVQNKPQELKTGLMIGGLINRYTYSALCFMASTVYFIYQT